MFLKKKNTLFFLGHRPYGAKQLCKQSNSMIKHKKLFTNLFTKHVFQMSVLQFRRGIFFKKCSTRICIDGCKFLSKCSIAKLIPLQNLSACVAFKLCCIFSVQQYTKMFSNDVHSFTVLKFVCLSPEKQWHFWQMHCCVSNASLILIYGTYFSRGSRYSI